MKQSLWCILYKNVWVSLYHRWFPETQVEIHYTTCKTNQFLLGSFRFNCLARSGLQYNFAVKDNSFVALSILLFLNKLCFVLYKLDSKLSLVDGWLYMHVIWYRYWSPLEPLYSALQWRSWYKRACWETTQIVRTWIQLIRCLSPPII